MPNTVTLRPDSHRPIYVPGEVITGNVILNNTDPFKCKGIYLTLSGVCETWATANPHCKDDDKSSRQRPQNEIVEFLKRTIEVVGANTYPPGQYQLPFNLTIPEYCVNESTRLRSDWGSSPLPSTISTTKNDGGLIKYQLKLVGKNASFFSFNLKDTREIHLASAASLAINQKLTRKRKFAQQRVVVNVYDKDETSWVLWAQRLAGLLTPTYTTPFRVKLTHSAIGLPACDIALNEIVSLTVTKPEGDDKKACDFMIHELEVLVKYTIISTADRVTGETTKNFTLLDKKDFPRVPLEFTPTGNGDKVCDITEFLSDARLNQDFGTERVPTLIVSATLEVNVGIMPTIGDPVIPAFAGLKSAVNFYNCLDNNIPPFVFNTSESELPPYEL